MIAASKNPLTVAVEAIIDATPGDFILISDVRHAVNHFAVRLNLHNISNFDMQIKAVMRRPKIKMLSLAKPGYVARFLIEDISKIDKAFIREQVSMLDSEKIKDAVSNALDLADA